MATASLWDQWKTSAYNALSEGLTGKPTPGSNAALQQQLERERLQRQIEQARKPSTPKSVAELVQDYEAISRLEGTNRARDNQQQLAYLGADSVLAAREAMNRQNIAARDAQTRNQQQLFESKADANLALLNPVLATERYGLDADSALSEKYLAHDMAKTQEILKAQQSAQTLPMIAGLLATAAALFA